MDPGPYIVIAALLTAAGTVLVSMRKLSGTVSTSAASDLWKESSAIRKWSTEQINQLQGEVRKLQTRLEEVASEAERCHRENVELRAKNAALEVVNDDLRKRANDH